jgi:hypothetical protein
MAQTLPISTKLVYACKICRIARGRCRQRGAPGHLPIANEAQSVKRRRSSGGGPGSNYNHKALKIRMVSSSSGGGAPPATKTTATFVPESCRRCKIAKGFCYKPDEEGHLTAAQCLPLDTMPRPVPRKKKAPKGHALATYVHPLAVAVLDRPMVDYNDAGYWRSGYDLASNSTTEWKASDAGNAAERAPAGAHGRRGFVFAPLMGWGGPHTGGR